jgi:hypothetical protein
MALMTFEQAKKLGVERAHNPDGIWEGTLLIAALLIPEVQPRDSGHPGIPAHWELFEFYGPGLDSEINLRLATLYEAAKQNPRLWLSEARDAAVFFVRDKPAAR